MRVNIMITSQPNNPKIYHIVHVDHLKTIIQDGFLFSDSIMRTRSNFGTVVGMGHIKERRISLPLTSYPDLMVGNCVPFYFCPRSVMLYLIHMNNHTDLAYHGGQQSIVHLEADMKEAIMWARRNNKRWVFTDSNAGSRYFEDYSNITQLSKLNWNAINTESWKDVREEKQAEFLLEERFPWKLFSKIGVINRSIYQQVSQILLKASYKPNLQVESNWYY